MTIKHKIIMAGLLAALSFITFQGFTIKNLELVNQKLAAENLALLSDNQALKNSLVAFNLAAKGQDAVYKNNLRLRDEAAEILDGAMNIARPREVIDEETSQKMVELINGRLIDSWVGGLRPQGGPESKLVPQTGPARPGLAKP